jgi:hypothetical protein
MVGLVSLDAQVVGADSLDACEQKASQGEAGG